MRGLQARKQGRLGAAGLIAGLALLLAPAAASADNTLLESFASQAGDENGAPYTQAGGHPFELVTEIEFKQHLEDGDPVVDENVRNVRIDLPAGLHLDSRAVPACTQAQLNAGIAGECPANAQVGQAEGLFGTTPVYNLAPVKGQAALFGARGFLTVRYIEVDLRADGGLRMTIPNLSQAFAVEAMSLTLWGVPADHIADFQGARNAFITNPTSCTGPLDTVLRANSWQHSDDDESLVSFDQIGTTGCEKLGFDADVDVASGTSASDSPGGLTVELTMPQQESVNPEGLVQSQLRNAEVTLPEGTSINLPMADGRAGCSPGEIGLGSSRPADCPDASKVGAAHIESPPLNEPLTGGIYLADPEHNPFDDPLAIYIAAGGSGVQMKLAGEVRRDQDTGQVTIAIEDAPQLPFSELSLRFFGGPRAAFATPVTCGTKSIAATLSPWSGNAPAEPSSSFTIDSGPGDVGCATTKAERPFDPTLVSGLVDPVAGGQGDFVLRVSRRDGEQEIEAIDATLPPGVSAMIGDVPRCADADAAAGTCGEQSRVGAVTVKSGAGANPFAVRGGSAYLAGPYKGAPVSLAMVVPVQAGIFELGEIVVRAAVHVDPIDARLRVISDPTPQVVDGVPLRIRQVAVTMDRPGFMTGPTNCDRKRVSAAVRGASGAEAEPSYRFQMADCGELGFAPKVKLAYRGKGATKRRGHPRLDLTLRPRAGDANLKRLALVLPRSASLDRGALKRACKPARYAADDCPKGSRVGSAKAKSPLLARPLVGDVHLVGAKRGRSSLVVDLNGAVDIDLSARIGSRKHRITAAFGKVPDVPVSRFDLTLKGGKRGLLVNGKDVCGKRKLRRANDALIAQSGKKIRRGATIRAACGKKR